MNVILTCEIKWKMYDYYLLMDLDLTDSAVELLFIVQ